MALATKRSARNVSGHVTRDSDASAANTQLVVVTPTGAPRKLLMVIVKYSGSPTQAGVATTILSGLGAAYHTLIDTRPANAQNSVYAPNADMIITDDDSFEVLAPAGGASITSQVSIYTEVL